MGKDLKGNELGKGLSQRKDGRYEARAKVNGDGLSINSFDCKISFILTFATFVFGTSIPTILLPGIGASILICPFAERA